MTPLELLSKLNKLWLVIDEENTDTNQVTLRNMIEPARAYFESGQTSLIDLWSELCDLAPNYPIQDQITCDNILDGLKAMDSRQLKEGELLASVFFHGLRDANHIPVSLYFYYANCIATALNISTDEDDVNPSFWQQAQDDELTPLEAALSCQQVHCNEAHQDIMDHIEELPFDEKSDTLNKIFSGDYDTSDYRDDAIDIMIEWDNDYLEAFYNELLAKNIKIIN